MVRENSENDNKNEVEKKKTQLTSFARYSALAFQMLAIILLFVFGGIKLDAYFQLTFKWFTLIGTVIGFVLSLYYSLKDLLKL